MEQNLEGLLDSIEEVNPNPPAGEAPLEGKDNSEIEIPKRAVSTGEAPVSPQYANDIARQVDEMYRKGATTAEVNNFFRLQSVDLSNMKSEELVKEGLKYEYPNLSAEDLTELYDEMYGEGVGAKAKREKDASDFRKKIAEMQQSAKEPAKEQDRIAKEARQKQLSSDWTAVSEAVADKQLKEVSLEFPTEDGQAHKFAFPVDDGVKAAMIEAGREFALAHNLSLDKSSIPKIQEHMKRVAFYLKGPEIFEAGIRDAVAKGLRLGLRQRINPQTPQNQNPRGQQEVNGMDKVRQNPFS